MAFSPFFDLVKYSKYCCPVNNYSPLLADATANALLFIYLCVASLVLRILQLTSVRLPFPGFLPEIQKRQPRKEGIREAPFLCPHL